MMTKEVDDDNDLKRTNANMQPGLSAFELIKKPNIRWFWFYSKLLKYDDLYIRLLSGYTWPKNMA